MMFESTVKKNILYVSPFTQEISGADESLLIILKNLDNNKFSPFVALPGKSPYQKKFEESGAKVLTFPFKRIKRTLNPFSILLYFASLPSETKRFRMAIKENKIDLLHSNMEVVLSCGYAAKKEGIKCIYHVRHNTYDKPAIVYNFLVKTLNKFCDRILVISKSVGKIFYKRNVKDKVTVLYNAIEPSRYFNESRDDYFEKNYNIKDNKKIVTTVGRIHPRKNLEDFIEMAGLVCKKRDDIVFAIVGEAHHDNEKTYLRKLKEAIKQRHIEEAFIFTGKQTAIPYIMKSSDVITISSFYEGFGRVVVEAMAVAKPLVGCDSGAIPEIMDYCEAGEIYPLGNVKAFRDSVLRLIDDPEEAKRLGEAGQKMVKEKYSFDIQRKKLNDIYRDIFENSITQD